jgi:uncharacterized protein
MSIQLNVLQELRHALGSESTYEINESRLMLDGSELSGAAGTLRLLRTDRGLLATLNLSADMGEKCARCLAEAQCRVEFEFEEEFVAEVDPNTGARLRVSENEEAFRIGPDFVLDLDEPIRQYGLLAEPLKPLCRPDCRGLCPTCGTNLNEESCECPVSADERLHALASLKLDTRKGS